MTYTYISHPHDFFKSQQIYWIWEFELMITPDDMNLIELLGNYYLSHSADISTLITSLKKVRSNEGKK